MTETPPRIALVTGGTRGIGLATVVRLLVDGWRVHFTGTSDESVAAALRRLREKLADPDAAGHVVDVRAPAAVEGLVATVEEREGRIDLLVSNAGVGWFAPVEEIEVDDWRRVIDTNLSGAFYVLRAVARGMKERGEGLVVHVVSLAGRHPFATGAAYAASKHGLLGLSDSAMLDLRPHGVRVAAVLPGSVATDFDHPAAGASDARDWMLDPDDVARAIADLVRYPDRALPSRVELRPTRTR